LCIELNVASVFCVRGVTLVRCFQRFVLEGNLRSFHASRFMFSRIVSKPRFTEHAILPVVFQIRSLCVELRISLTLFFAFPSELGSDFRLPDFHAAFLSLLTLFFGLVPAEVVHGTLPVLLAGFFRLAIGGAHGLEGPVAEHVAVGSCLAVRVVVAGHIDR
jgi:hypothetical protein